MRNDHRHITSLITPQTKVLEIGCGSGELLFHLTHNRGCSASGIEIMTDNVQQCLAKGLSVMQGNAGEHLSHYSDDSFDYVVLSHYERRVKSTFNSPLKSLFVSELGANRCFNKIRAIQKWLY